MLHFGNVLDSKGWALSPHCAKGNGEPQAELDFGYVSVRADILPLRRDI